MTSALLGRIHLSGLLPELAPDALALVHEAVAVHKAIRGDLATAVPAWPLGLPGWDDPWLALALHNAATTDALDTVYVTVWWRPGDGSEESAVLPFPSLRGTRVGVTSCIPPPPRRMPPGTRRPRRSTSPSRRLRRRCCVSPSARSRRVGRARQLRTGEVRSHPSRAGAVHSRTAPLVASAMKLRANRENTTTSGSTASSTPAITMA
ncbi:hypothetical protein [Streptomyces flaveus]|uniref:hypothetical protein n=1 Tax=Streptomyces flaveus TaxID=66370 RepID=UPI0033242242